MTTFGSGQFTYQVVDNWAKKPRGFAYTDVAGVAVDSRDRVYLFTRGAHPVMVFDKDGAFIRSWGEGLFARAHGISIDAHDNVWCADDLNHTVSKFDTNGNLLLTLGTPGVFSDTGYNGGDMRSVRRAGPPFNRPTKAVVVPSGDVYVADGYGNARVHVFSARGELKRSWGEPGTEPGQFVLPHSLAVDEQGKVYVADRQNHRIQVFNPDGLLLTIWDGLHLPMDMVIDGDYMYIAEGGHRLSIWRLSGQKLVEWGGEGQSNDAGMFIVPHCIARDARGVLYVGEVCDWNGYDRGCRAVQKFVPL